MVDAERLLGHSPWEERQSNVIKTFARLAGEKMPGAAVATVCPKQEKPAGQK